MELTTLFDHASERKASDLHLASGEVPRVRIEGNLVSLDLPTIDRPTLASMLQPALPADAKFRLESGRPVERTVLHGDLAFAGVVFRQGDDGLAATFRILGKGIPELVKIGEGAMPLFERIVGTARGLVLISGPTGSGKWTTACSLTDAINETKAARIFVVGEHPNYRFESKKSMVTMLHVGQDCDSYVQALQIALMADLDVVAVDDVPTTEALRQMLILAETGHLVIANLHSENAADAIKRLLDSAGEDSLALRASLSQNLVVVTGQRLLPRAERPGRVPAYEWIGAGEATRAALLAGDIDRLRGLQETESESRSLTQALRALVAEGLIAEESALALS